MTLFKKISTNSIIIFFALLIINIYAATFYFDHNDFMYSAAPQISGHLYTELAFVQAPMSYWLWKFVGSVGGDGYSYLVMRVTSASLSFAAILPWLSVVIKNQNSRILLLFTFAANYYSMRSGYEIANYSVVAFFTSIGLVLLTYKNTFKFFLSGIFLGISVSFKINFSLFFFCAIIYILMFHHKKPIKLFLFTFGWFLGTLPVAYYIFTGFDDFVFFNILFHSDITNAARGLTTSSSLKDIAKDIIKFATYHQILIFVVLLSFLLSNSPNYKLSTNLKMYLFQKSSTSWLVIIATCTSIAVAASPFIMFDQYLSYSSLLLCVLAAKLVDDMENKYRKPLSQVLIILFGFILVFNTAVMMQRDNAVQGHFSARNYINELIASESSGLLANHRCNRVMFTLSGSLALDTNIELAKIAIGGPFWVGKGAYFSNEIKSKYNNRLKYYVDPIFYIESEQPQYVMLGYYKDFEPTLQAKFEDDFYNHNQSLGYIHKGQFEFLGKYIDIYENKLCNETSN